MNNRISTQSFMLVGIISINVILLFPIIQCYSLRPIYFDPSASPSDLEMSLSAFLNQARRSSNNKDDETVPVESDKTVSSSAIAANGEDAASASPSTDLDDWDSSTRIQTKPVDNLKRSRDHQQQVDSISSWQSGPRSLYWINGRTRRQSNESRVKKALSLFAHWKPSYNNHMDDAYSSELVSAVSRGNGRAMGQALRWG